MNKELCIGLDFGTLEARAALVDAEGNMLSQSAFAYPNGVMTRRLPGGTPLEADFALQHPADYIAALEAMIPRLFEAGADPDAVVGIGVDFTQCTMMPVDENGTPLCLCAGFEENPHAYAKLWKHHAAQPQAQRLTEAARRTEEPFLRFCGGTVYAESMFPKVLEIFEKAPEVYGAAAGFVELADWIPRYLTGTSDGSQSIAGCAALWSPTRGYPSSAFLESVAPGFGGAAGKLPQRLAPVGTAVGRLSGRAAMRLGLSEGIPVAAGLGDCQAAFLGAGLAEPGVMLSVMGTSSCDLLVSREERTPSGVYGVAYGSMVPGLYGYEAGQACMGDLFGWFAQNWVPPDYSEKAEAAGVSIFDYLNTLAEKIEATDTGLLALDWWNGNRSILLDTDLSGLVLGLTMNTRCEEIYLALAQALCFGKRRIVEHLRESGLEINRLRVTGSVAVKNPFFMQLLADTLEMPVELSTAENGSCLGSAIYAALAAGCFKSPAQAARSMGGGVERVYRPREHGRARRRELYEAYWELHDYFGKTNPVMKRLKALREGRNAH